MEGNEGSSGTGVGTRKGLFTIPSLSEIKRANKVSVLTSAPSLFNQHKPQKTTRSVAGGPPSATSTTAEATCVPNRPNSGHQPGTSGTSQDEDQKTLNEGSSQSRKRTRDDVEIFAEIPSKLAAGMGNERVIPTHGNNLQKPTVAVAPSSTDHPLLTTDDDDVRLVGGAVAASEGVASVSTSTSQASVHHPHAIIANPVQKKNPLMKHIRNIPWELGNIVPDFVLGKTACAMFLSVRYHSLHPNYIHTRLKELGKLYQLRILLVLVDMKESQKVLQELAKIAVLADLTLMLAWSYEEAGRYLETYKAFENKPPDMLMERIDSDFFSRATECLTTVKKVNKTDAATLLSNFKTMEKVITASREELVLCPGLGPQKAQRLFSLFHQPFKTSTKLSD